MPDRRRRHSWYTRDESCPDEVNDRWSRSSSPSGVWAAIVALEPFPSHLALAPEVRERLRKAIVTPAEARRPTAFRTLVLSWGEAELLVDWLNTLLSRRDSPRECRAAIELVREGQRLAT